MIRLSVYSGTTVMLYYLFTVCSQCIAPQANFLVPIVVLTLENNVFAWLLLFESAPESLELMYISFQASVLVGA